MHNKLMLKTKRILQLIFVLLLLASFNFSQDDIKNNKGSADKNLKSAARVNPSTLAMEFSLPLAVYPGRAGNSVPVGLNYSSKLWEIEPFGNWSMPAGSNRAYYTDTSAKFAERTAAGWTSSLTPPRLEIKEEYYNEQGEPWSFQNALLFHESAYESLLTPKNLPAGCFETDRDTFCVTMYVDGVPQSRQCTTTIYAYCHHGTGWTTFDQPDPSPGGGGNGGWGGATTHQISYVKRVRVFMPDGSSREFRQDDSVNPYCTTYPNDSYCNGTENTYQSSGTYLSVDGSRMRLVVGEGTQDSFLYMPDGSKYVFGASGKVSGNQYATEFSDVNGNRTLYGQTGVQDPTIEDGKIRGTVTDTLERPGIYNPFAQNKDVNLNPSDQLYQLPGMGGTTTQDYTLRWAELEDVIDDPSNNPLSYVGQSVCFIGGQNTLVTHNDGSGSATPETDDDDGPILFNSGFRTRLCSSIGGSGGRIFNPVVLSKVLLPNGTEYGFKYNRYGEITEIKYPSGGYEKFEYGELVPIGSEPSEVYDQANRGVKEHWIYDFGGALKGYTSYEESINNGQYPISATAPYKITTTNQDGSKTIRFLNRSGDVKYGFTDPLSGMPSEEQTIDKNNQIRQRVLTDFTWTGPLPGGDTNAKRDGRPTKQISVIIENGQALAKMSETVYENPDEPGSTVPSHPSYFARLNVKQSKMYSYQIIDNLVTAETGTFAQLAAYFNNKTPERIRETEYLYGEDGDKYKTRNIIGLPKTVKLIDPQTNQPIAKTEFKYDEQGQYYTNLGSTTGYQAPTGAYSELRGNITTTRSWVKETDTWLEAHAQYDNFGNLRKAWDVGGDQSKFVETQYNEEFKYAYPTKVITPAPDLSDARGTTLTSQVSTNYDFTTGLPLSVTDDFGQITQTQYDNRLRPKKIIPPAGGSVAETEYGDTPGDLYVKIKKQIDENNWAESTTYLDGLGRVFKTKIKDSQGDVFTQTEYDEMGRVKRTTNPYRQGEAMLWSSPRFDELGRTVETFAPAPDGQQGQSLGVTQYDISTAPNFVGTVIITTDAAGRKGRAFSNALGQLVRVDEPSSTNGLDPVPRATPTATPTPGGGGGGGTINCAIPANCPVNLAGSEYPMNSTYYKYNVQGKLVEVTQGAQKRYFLYNSQGRLIRVRQPEQEINPALELDDPVTGNKNWTAGSTYDALGNIKTSVDAKGAKVIYDYDRNNRIITRCYVPASVQVSSETCTGLQSSQLDPKTPKVDYYYDGKGVDQSAGGFLKGKLTKVTSSVSETKYTSFDNFGRLKSSEQITDGKSYPSTYSYNLSGALTLQSYPSGRLVYNTVQSDGDLGQVQSRAASTVAYKNYASDFSYAASGSISQMKLGNGKWETRKVNNRMQVSEIGLGTSATDASLWKVNFDYGELNEDGTINTNKNSGTIAKQTIDFSGLAQPFVQTYKYDSLSRLTEAREKTGSQTNWVQQYSYDRYGNRNGFNEQIGSFTSDQTPAVDSVTNRFTDTQKFGYDKNGNITGDIVSNQGRQFVFNGDNRQVQIKNDGGAAVGQYFYDGEGRRVKKITDQETTVFAYDGMGKLVAEYSTQTPPAQRTTNYLTADHLNTPRVITDAAGNVKARRDFMPYGEELGAGIGGRTGDNGQKYSATTDHIRQKFTGYQRDGESSLDFAEARMYDSQSGRFTAVDPLLASGKSINPQTFNRYAYTSNNPVIRVDTNGLEWWDVINKNTGERTIFFSMERPVGGENITVAEWTQYVYKASDGSWYGLDPNSAQYFHGRYENAYWGHGIFTDFNGGFNGVFEGGGLAGLGYDLASVKDMAYLIAYMKTGNIDGALGMFAKISGMNAAGGVLGKYVGKAGSALLNRFLASEVGQALTAKAMPMVEKAMGKVLCCFVAGTLIHTDRGLVPIEQIKVGDKVLSYNEKTKQFEYKAVATTFVGVKDNIVKLKVAGEKQLFTTTTEHPFYVRKAHKARDGLSAGGEDEDGEWKTAEFLKVGDKVLRPDGKWTRILEITRDNQPTTVYNFEVEDNHSYFVGEIGVLSHNCDLAYKTALEGGKHANFLKNNLDLPTNILEKSIKSFEENLKIHENLLRDPAKYLKEYGKGDWDLLDPRRQEALINKIWVNEIANFREQINILRGVINSRQ